MLTKKSLATVIAGSSLLIAIPSVFAQAATPQAPSCQELKSTLSKNFSDGTFDIEPAHSGMSMLQGKFSSKPGMFQMKALKSKLGQYCTITDTDISCNCTDSNSTTSMS